MYTKDRPMKAKYDIPLWQSFHFTNKLILIWQALKQQGMGRKYI